MVAGAYGFILAPNHPSGDASPSEADRRVTRRIVDGAEILQIRFFDHVVAGSDSTQTRYYSFREAGLI